MIPTRILLDMDDVLNRFTMQALAHVGCAVDPTSFDDFNPAWGFDIIEAANALHPNKGLPFTLDSFWGWFSRRDWASWPKSDECNWLIDNCERLVGRENICILTSPVLNPSCAAGKIEWIYEFCPEWLHRQYLIGPMKHMCARPDALLIDDSDANVEAFQKHGGQAVLVPRPWNSGHKFNAMRYLRDAFKMLFEQKQFYERHPWLRHLDGVI